MLPLQKLADHLKAQGIEVVRVLNQTSHRPGVSPDVVTAIGLELGKGLCVYQYRREGIVVLYQWENEGDDWVEIGDYESGEVEDLVKAIREFSSHPRAYPALRSPLLRHPTAAARHAYHAGMLLLALFLLALLALDVVAGVVLAAAWLRN
jgi:hypothetical protein